MRVGPGGRRGGGCDNPHDNGSLFVVCIPCRLTGNSVFGVTAVLELDEREPHSDVDFLMTQQTKHAPRTRRDTYVRGTGTKAAGGTKIVLGSSWLVKRGVQ